MSSEQSDGGIAVGSYQDLEADRGKPIDRNPSIPCRICGEKYGWMDYWKERITGRDRDPREVPYECDGCRDEIEEMRRRLSGNASIDEWGGADV